MRWLFGVVFIWCLLIVQCAFAACGPDATPAPAAARGYTCEVFWDHFADLSTVDVNNVCGATPSAAACQSYHWFTNNKWPGLAGGSSIFQNMVSTPASALSIASGGGVVLNPPDSANQGLTLASCATNGNANQWIGTTVSGGVYIRYAIKGLVPGKYGTNSWWPVVWTFPTEILASLSPGVPYTEVDVAEWLLAPGNSWAGNIIDWTPSTQGTTSPFQTEIGLNPDTNTYAALIVPPAENGGTGFVAGYENDVLNSNGTNTQTWVPGGAHSVVTSQHNCLMMSAASDSPNPLMTVSSVEVFQMLPSPQGAPAPWTVAYIQLMTLLHLLWCGGAFIATAAPGVVFVIRRTRRPILERSHSRVPQVLLIRSSPEDEIEVTPMVDGRTADHCESKRT